MDPCAIDIIYCLPLRISLTTEGSARVEVSPRSSVSPRAIFLRILLIILPLLVFGSPGANCLLVRGCNRADNLSDMPDQNLLEFRGGLNALLQCHIYIDTFSLDVMGISDGCGLCHSPWLTRADSISAVPILWPDTLITSSILPINP